MQIIETYRKAILDHLNADSATSSVVNIIADFIPRSTSYPYIKLGDTKLESVKNTLSTEHSIEVPIHIYSDYKGEKELIDICKLVTNTLNNLDINALDCYIFKHNKTIINQDRTGKFYSAELLYKLEARV